MQIAFIKNKMLTKVNEPILPKSFHSNSSILPKLIQIYYTHIHTHTHTHIYIYIYIYINEKRYNNRWRDAVYRVDKGYR